MNAIFDYNFGSNNKEQNKYNITKAEQVVLPNLFKYNHHFTGGMQKNYNQNINLSKRKYMNSKYIKQNFRHYQNMINSNRDVFMVFKNNPFLNFSSNLFYLYQF